MTRRDQLLAAHATMHDVLRKLCAAPVLSDSRDWVLYVRQVGELSGERIDALLEDPLGDQRAAARRAIYGLEQALARLFDEERCS